MKILVADDDAMLRALLQHRLSAVGYDVIEAENGAQAIDLIFQHTPDLVVLDGMMPVMDGFETLRRIRRNPSTITLPVVMLTARRAEEDVVSALKLGANDYIVKPFIPDELVQRIRRLDLGTEQDASTAIARSA